MVELEPEATPATEFIRQFEGASHDAMSGLNEHLIEITNAPGSSNLQILAARVRPKSATNQTLPA